ncbi:collagen binding domain-containing protein [Lysinibacillus sp. NPDC097195]|uniref:collagen binding domain-containing protein n=1 Tax=Lysinibacillus sp. NPDC097195 TaxID=3364141 RepID=UPI00380508BB
MKKLNLAIITLLLVFQTVLSPISVFADDVDSTLPPSTEVGTDEGTEEGTPDGTEAGEDTDDSTVTPPEGNEEDGEVVEEEPTEELKPEVLLDENPKIAKEIPASLTAFKMEIGGKEVGDGNFDTELPTNTVANFTVKFSVPMQDDEKEAWGDGSWFEFQLPKSLIDFDGAFFGKKTVNGITYNYTTTDNKVRVELSGMTPEASSPQPEDLIINFASGFNNLSDDIEQDLEIPAANGGSEIIKASITFIPSTSGEKVNKEKIGTPIATASGNHEMEWEVWVNKAGKELINPTLTDEATGGHAIVDGSVNVYQYVVGLNGVRDKGGTGIEVFTNGNWGNIESKLTGKFAYKITYKTQVTLEADGRDGNAKFNNKVTFTNNGTPEVSEATHEITYGKALAKKKVSSTNYKSSWRIDYNHNLLNIDQAKAVITDTITGPHEIDISSIKVYKMNDADGNIATSVAGGEEITTGFTITTDTGDVKAFTLKFDAAISDAYTIVYDANYNKQDFYENETGSFKNNVKSGSDKSVDVPYTLAENLLSKSHTVDFDEKVINWEIVIKSDNPNKAISNLTLTDTFTNGAINGEHELIEKSVKLDGQAVVYALIDENKTKGFTITGINVPAGGKVTVTYQTSFAINDEGEVETQGYGNTAETEWTSGTKTYKKTATDDYVPGTTTVNNGSKSGKFNYLTQRFTWDVKVNINKKDISGAVLVDTVGEGHKYVAGTIEVLPLTGLGGSDTGGTISTTPIDKGSYKISNETEKGFTLTFNNDLGDLNNKAYVVRYQTMDDDNILGIGSEAPSEKGNVYKNGATFKTKGTQEFTLDSTPVTIDENVANNLIKKNTPTQNATTEKITWTLEVNRSHSNLGNNVTLTDLPGNNLMLLEESIKIAPYKVSEDDITKDNSWKTPQELGLSVTFDSKGGFSLVFPDLNKKGYQVKYETVGFGKAGDNLENTATLNYNNETKPNQNTEDRFNGEMTFSSSDSDFTSTRGSAKFKKIGIDSATGQFKENLGGVTFQLIKKTAKNEYIIKTATTDTNGEITFENVPYNDYLIREVTAPSGYDKMEDFKFKLDENTTLDKHPDLVKELVNTTQVTGCTQFEFAINDVDGTPITSGKVTLKDKNGVETSHDVNNGKVTLPEKYVAGDYTVTHSVEGNLGKVTVKYDGTCKAPATIQPAPNCPQFTVSLFEMKDSSKVARPGVTVTLKDSTGNLVTVKDENGSSVVLKTDADGKFIMPSTKDNPDGIKAGEYSVYEGNQYLGMITVSYKVNCEYELLQAPKCPTFELTVKDVDGKLVADGTSVTVKGADKNIVATETTTNGIIELTNLEPGVYTVEVDGKVIGSFQSNIDCEATVQPTPACTQFTLTVKDEDGNIRPNISNIIIKDKNGAIIATGKTNELGQILIESKDIPSGDYDVYQGDLYIGQITVQYSINCEAEISAAPACPSFTLTVQTAFGTPLANAKVTVKDAKGNVVKDADGNDVVTTSVAGTIVLPNKAIQQGTYYVYEGSRLIGSFTVKDTCSALVKPALPGGGGGGSTPDPGNPEEPNKPAPDPGNPENPNKPTPDPGNPENPNKPTPDPGNPENPNKPTPDPGNPENPNKPTPDPGNPEDPNKPNPDPGKPVDPEKPTTNPGNPSTDSKDPTTPGKPETSKPSVQDVIEQGKNLPPYNPSTATKDKLDAYKDFLDKYNNLSQEEQANVAKTLDINKIKEDAKRLEAQLKAQGKLPQTDGATQTGLTLVGVVLVLGALFFLRRRNVEM